MKDNKGNSAEVGLYNLVQTAFIEQMLSMMPNYRADDKSYCNFSLAIPTNDPNFQGIDESEYFNGLINLVMIRAGISYFNHVIGSKEVLENTLLKSRLYPIRSFKLNKPTFEHSVYLGTSNSINFYSSDFMPKDANYLLCFNIPIENKNGEIYRHMNLQEIRFV